MASRVGRTFLAAVDKVALAIKDMAIASSDLEEDNPWVVIALGRRVDPLLEHLALGIHLGEGNLVAVPYLDRSDLVEVRDALLYELPRQHNAQIQSRYHRHVFLS